jgi:hypothetical protein
MSGSEPGAGPVVEPGPADGAEGGRAGGARAPAPPPPRDAVVFIPGISGAGSPVDQTTEGIAKRLAVALDRRARTGGARFQVEVRTEDFGNGLRTDASTVFRRAGPEKAAEPVLDVYGLDYHEALVGDFKSRSLAMRSLLLLGGILISSWRIVSAMVDPRRNGKTFRDKFQFFYGGAIIALMSAYLAVLAAALLDVAFRALGVATSGSAEAVTAVLTTATAATASPSAGEGGTPWLAPLVAWLTRQPWLPIALRAATTLVVVVSTAALFVPRRGRDTLEDLGRNYYCLSGYLDVGARRAVMIGRLEALLEHLAEKPVPPPRVHVVGYSFGSVLALDALLPQGRAAGPRFGMVTSLVTIGCPFDLIRTFWPRHFTGRRLDAAPAFPRWINVYSSADVLGSNFRNDQADGAATESVTLDAQSAGKPPLPENVPYANRALGALEILLFAGLRAHSIYWEEKFEAEDSCFHDVVARLWEGDPVLS